MYRLRWLGIYRCRRALALICLRASQGTWSGSSEGEGWRTDWLADLVREDTSLKIITLPNSKHYEMQPSLRIRQAVVRPSPFCTLVPDLWSNYYRILKDIFLYLSSSWIGNKTALTSGLTGGGAFSDGVLESAGVKPRPGSLVTIPRNLSSPISRIRLPSGVLSLLILTGVRRIF